MGWNQAGNIRGPQGPQGTQGIQGPAGAAGVNGINPRGAWSSANTYAVKDVVNWGGSSYYATVAKAAGDPPPTGTSGDPGSDDQATNAGWEYLALQGAQGPQGTQGPAGSAGAAGTTGPQGAAGARGSRWFIGTGAPTAGNTSGALAGDKYLDGSNGDVYDLT